MVQSKIMLSIYTYVIKYVGIQKSIMVLLKYQLIMDRIINIQKDL